MPAAPAPRQKWEWEEGGRGRSSARCLLPVGQVGNGQSLQPPAWASAPGRSQSRHRISYHRCLKVLSSPLTLEFRSLSDLPSRVAPGTCTLPCVPKVSLPPEVPAQGRARRLCVHMRHQKRKWRGHARVLDRGGACVAPAAGCCARPGHAGVVGLPSLGLDLPPADGFALSSLLRTHLPSPSPLSAPT